MTHLDLLPLMREQGDRELTAGVYDSRPNEYAHAMAAEAIEGFLEENLSSE